MKIRRGPLAVVRRWLEQRGHDTNDVWCIHWVGHCRGPIATCPTCAITGGYYAERKRQLAAERARRGVRAAATEGQSR